jgi:MFS family permease
VYFTLGSLGGAWLGRLPDVQRHLDLSTGELGNVLLVGAVGGLAAMQLVPLLLRRFGHRSTLGTLAVIMPVSFLAIPIANNGFMLAVALVLTSGMCSMVGILANTHAADVERAYERGIMSSLHAMYSIGALFGAGLAGLLAGADVPVITSISAAVIVHFLLISYFIRWLLQVAHASPRSFDKGIDHLAHHKHRKQWWRGVLLVGSLTFVAYLAESTVVNWSALFMREYRDAAPAMAVSAFAAFSACMAAGRLSGDYLANRFGRIQVVQVGALLGSAGLFIGLCIPNVAATIVGFALVGCGLSVLVPLLFSIAGNLSGGESGAAIARVGTIAYTAVLIGPAAIGMVAERFNLVVALLIPAAALLYLATASSYIQQVERRRPRRQRALKAAKAAKDWLAHALN